MRKTILLYGLFISALAFLLRYIDYRFMVKSMSMEIYVGLISLICTGIGIWMGLRLTRGKPLGFEEIPNPQFESQNFQAAALPPKFAVDSDKLQALNISRREYEVLELMALGHSNQEIAEQLFISLPTVKTHGSRLFSKLQVKRRMQAVQEAQRQGILP